MFIRVMLALKRIELGDDSSMLAESKHAIELEVVVCDGYGAEAPLFLSANGDAAFVRRSRHTSSLNML